MRWTECIAFCALVAGICFAVAMCHKEARAETITSPKDPLEYGTFNDHYGMFNPFVLKDYHKFRIEHPCHQVGSQWSCVQPNGSYIYYGERQDNERNRPN